MAKYPELPRPMTELQQTYLIISDPLSDVVLVLRLILLVLII